MDRSVILLARIIKRGAQISEESYDHAEADRMTKEEKYPQYSRCYKKTLEEACKEAAKEARVPELGRIVYLALNGWWNDSLDWAEQYSNQ